MLSKFFKMFEELNKAMEWYSTSTYQNKNFMNLDKEESHYEKKGVKSVVTTFFDDEGRPCGTMTTTTWTEAKNNKAHIEELTSQIEAAIKEEDYMKAAQLKKEKDKLQ